MVEMYNCDEGRRRHLTAPTKCGFSDDDAEPWLLSDGCQTAANVMP